jgi:hypothetical protein
MPFLMLPVVALKCAIIQKAGKHLFQSFPDNGSHPVLQAANIAGGAQEY